jgi:hypothetical protein
MGQAGRAVVAREWSLEGMIEGYERLIAAIYRKKCRAGEPAWGPEILIRHQLVGITDDEHPFYTSDHPVVRRANRRLRALRASRCPRPSKPS